MQVGVDCFGECLDKREELETATAEAAYQMGASSVKFVYGYNTHTGRPSATAGLITAPCSRIHSDAMSPAGLCCFSHDAEGIVAAADNKIFVAFRG